MSPVIGMGRDVPLGAQAGTFPNLSGALSNWFQPMTFGVVTKDVEGMQSVETKVDVTTKGVWQPFTDRMLSIKPEGERAWKWYMLHALPSLELNPDDVVIYLGTQYRVMATRDYRLNGYVEYHLIQDYTGSGPTDAP